MAIHPTQKHAKTTPFANPSPAAKRVPTALRVPPCGLSTSKMRPPHHPPPQPLKLNLKKQTAKKPLNTIFKTSRLRVNRSPGDRVQSLKPLSLPTARMNSKLTRSHETIQTGFTGDRLVKSRVVELDAAKKSGDN